MKNRVNFPAGKRWQRKVLSALTKARTLNFDVHFTGDVAWQKQ